MTDHPITPPPELIQQWWENAKEEHSDNWDVHAAVSAARWGADQELEACCEWIHATHFIDLDGHHALRAARRPKPPSLKQQALTEMELLETHGLHACCLGTLRRALESLPDPQD